MQSKSDGGYLPLVNLTTPVIPVTPVTPVTLVTPDDYLEDPATCK